MNIVDIQTWLETRSKRERYLVIIVGCAIIYVFWNLILNRPIELQQKELDKKIQETRTHLNSFKQQADTIVIIADKYSYYQKIQEQKRLTSQSKLLKQKAGSIDSVTVSQKSISSLTKDVIALQPGIILNSLKELDVKPWVINDNPKTTSFFSQINKQAFELKFRGSYFDTMRYINHLEKLQWHLYWDSMEYVVGKYPEAEVMVKFYVLVVPKV